MEKILLRLAAGEREEFRKRCEARGMTMTGCLKLLIQRDKWEFESNPPREYREHSEPSDMAAITH